MMPARWAAVRLPEAAPSTPSTRPTRPLTHQRSVGAITSRRRLSSFPAGGEVTQPAAGMLATPPVRWGSEGVATASLVRCSRWMLQDRLGRACSNCRGRQCRRSRFGRFPTDRAYTHGSGPELRSTLARQVARAVFAGVWASILGSGRTSVGRHCGGTSRSMCWVYPHRSVGDDHQ